MGPVRKVAGFIAVFTLLAAVSSEAQDENSTEPAIVDQELARQKAFETFVLLSPYPRNDCLNTFGVPETSFNANELMDMALEFIREMIKKENMDHAVLPNFSEGFTKKVGFIKVKGSFEGKDGWVESLASIARKGNATVNLNGTSVSLDSTLGLNVLQLGMNYNAKLAFIRVRGKLDAKVRSNAVSFSGGLDYSTGKCQMYLRHLTLSELGKIDVHVTGLGKLNWLYSKIVTWVTSRLQKKIKETVETKLKDVIEEEMKKIQCPSPL